MPADTDNQRKFYLCGGHVVSERDLFKFPREHIVGHLVYRDDEGRKVTGLAIWNVSMPTTAVPLLRPRVKTVALGDSRDIACDQCPNHPRWEGGNAYQEANFERFFKKHYPEGWRVVFGEEER